MRGSYRWGAGVVERRDGSPKRTGTEEAAEKAEAVRVAAERVVICWEGCVVRTLVVVKGSDDAWLVAMGGGSGGEVRRVAEGNGNGGGPKTDRGSGGDIPRGVLVVRTIGWDGMDLVVWREGAAREGQEGRSTRGRRRKGCWGRGEGRQTRRR
jgi:hypothetical protein